MLNIRFKEKTNAWPGFVDLFSNLVIILVFLLIVFVFLWTTTNVFNAKATSKKVTELRQQNADQTEQIAQMTADEAEAKDLLLLSRSQMEALEQENAGLNQKMGQLQSQISSLAQEYQRTADATAAERNALQNQIQQLKTQLMTAETSVAQQQVLAAEVNRLSGLLNIADQRARDQETQYVEMSGRLNKAMADRIAELNQYQSEFYGTIKRALQDSNKVDTSTDRFVVPSDILFARGSYTLSAEGKRQLKMIAPAIASLETMIPANVPWIIRVDGHTDKTPVVPGTTRYVNNTQLSLLRAQAVVNELVRAGISPRRLAPTGFGETHPVNTGNTAAAMQKNRRIELRLTNP